MRKTVKIWLIVAALLIVLGAAVFGLAAYSVGWDLTKLGGGRYETNTYEIEEKFSNISIKTDTADVVFVPSEEQTCKVVCYEEKNKKHSVSATDGVLTVNVEDTQKWYERISWFASEKITVYLPEREYASLVIEESTGNIGIPNDFTFKSIDVSVSTGNVTCSADATETVKIKGSTGDLRVENISAGALDLTTSTGNITLLNVTCEGDIGIVVSTGKTIVSDTSCKNLTSTGSTGNISLRNVIAQQTFSVQRSTGSVKFDGCDAAELEVKTTTGDVTGTLLSEKIFITKTGTGDINVPTATTGGTCKITTSTGNIKIQIK